MLNQIIYEHKHRQNQCVNESSYETATTIYANHSN